MLRITSRAAACAALVLLASAAAAQTTPLRVSRADAVRLTDQATFGATEALLLDVQTQGIPAWLQAQFALNTSRYTRGGGPEVHQNVQSTFFCDRPPYAGPNCWRDWFSTQPLLWDFYRNALTQPDQLRQRVAFALQQIVVVSGLEVSGTYGMRRHFQGLHDLAFGNYRQVLRHVALSPVMGDFLNNANNDKIAPNENFARELLQLFSIGACQLNADGTLQGGACTPAYDNATVRNYAYSLTGWTYPVGGSATWGCWPTGTQCTFYGGDMIPAPTLHDAAQRNLLGGVFKPAGSTAPQALDLVLDSLMQHPNMAPFIGRQLIQFLVTSNPTPAYVQRVAQTFRSGRYVSRVLQVGSGVPGDLAATVTAILLDSEARAVARQSSPSAGRLRDPVLFMTGVLRGLNGSSDGEAMSWWWGDGLRQHVFRAPSVFNFYPPDYPVAGTDLQGPAFGIHNANTALARLNFLVYLLDWNGSAPDASIPGALGTRVSLDAFVADAADPAKLVDRMALLALGEVLPPAARQPVITAVTAESQQNSGSTWQRRRVAMAAYLIYGSPQYQVHK
jgi:uncharacterized protein (DUF1800 family)